MSCPPPNPNLTNYTLALTETADGRGDHGHYKKRRASAITIATNLGITAQDGSPLTDNGKDIVDRKPVSAGQSWVYNWYVQGDPICVKRLVNIFNAFEYVTVVGGPP
jgi:hypothetical protein